MAADAKGNDLTQVDIPIDGQIWIGPSSVAVLEKEALIEPVLSVPATLEPLGLLTTDGGPEWSIDGTGDATEFFQEGYQLPGQGGAYLLKVVAAQNQALTDQLINGTAFDEDGYREVRQLTNPTVYTVLSQVIYKSGRIERSMSNNVTVSEGAKQKAERPNVRGTELTFKWMPMANGLYKSEVKFTPAAG